MNPASTTTVEDCLNALAEHSTEVIIEVGSDTKLTYVSPNAGTVLGIDAAELAGLDLGTVAAMFDVAPKEQVQGGAGPLSLSELIARGPYQSVRSIRTPDGGTQWIDIAVTQFDSGHRATAVVRDITQRVQLEEQLIRAQKLESLGVLAGGVAHSFNNLLMGILGNVELAISEVEDSSSSKILPLLWAVVAAATRAEESTHQLLTYAGKGSFEMSGLDLSNEVRSSRGLLRSVVAGKVALDFELRGWLPKIQADSKQLNQILVNLVLNAVEACGETGGKVVVSTGVLDLEEHSSDAIRIGLPPGAYTYVAVSDDGEGIDPEVQLKVFDPFFTTRIGGGGLGLAASLGIARAHGGTIVVDSKPRQGSTFKVLLPVSEQPVMTVPSTTAADAQSREKGEGEGLILVVDDEDYVRQLAGVGLRRSGYNVLTANSGKRAIELFAEHSDEIDLLITDLAMPEMNGEELIAELRRTHPDIPMLLMSGYSRSAVNEELVNLPTVGFVQKPFLLSELAACVRRMTTSA